MAEIVTSTFHCSCNLPFEISFYADPSGSDKQRGQQYWGETSKQKATSGHTHRKTSSKGKTKQNWIQLFVLYENIENGEC